MLYLTRTELRRYPLFSAFMVAGCPVIYMLLLWLDGWSTMPAAL